MKTIFVTGATGILGSNACTMLIEKGYKARATVRDLASTDAENLRKAGVEVVAGDLTDLDSMKAAAKGADGVIHSGAMLGRPGATWEEGWPTNAIGTINVLTAAYEAGGIPTIQVLTTTFFNNGDKPLDEHSPIDFRYQSNDVYTVTKRLAYAEGVTRAKDGQDVRFMIPGAIYGPSVCVDRANSASSFNDRLIKALKNEMPSQLPLPMPWVTAEDCAFVCVAALEKGERGERYIAHGVTTEAGTIAQVCNQMIAVAGLPHRVAEIGKDELDSPEIASRYGPSIPVLAKRTYPVPFSDSSFTEQKLGYKPTSLKEGLPQTLAWLREVGAV